MTRRSEDGVEKKNQIIQEISSDNEGRDGGDIGLNGRKWMSAEDAILVDYVRNNGNGNWKDAEKNSGLSRNANSCQLCWMARPRHNLKKSPFSEEEELSFTPIHRCLHRQPEQSSFTICSCCSSPVFDLVCSILSMPQPVHPTPSDGPDLLEDNFDKEKSFPRLEKGSIQQMADVSSSVVPTMDVNQRTSSPEGGNASFIPNTSEEHQSFDTLFDEVESFIKENEDWVSE